MKILALDTATNACSAALLLDGSSIQRYQIAPREHSSLILAMLDELMAEAGVSLSTLDAIAFGQGPGSFVGLRIAASVTQGIAFSHELPVVPVSSLAALAQGSGFDNTLTAFDARMGEVYWGAYSRNSDNIMELVGVEMVCKPGQVICPGNTDMTRWAGVGTGWSAYEKELTKQLPGVVYQADILYPEAKDIAILGANRLKLGGAVAAQDVQPVYIRNQVAKSKKTM